MQKTFRPTWLIPPLLLCPALIAGAAPDTPPVAATTGVALASSVPANTAPGAHFQFMGSDSWGGQPLVSPRPIYCTPQPNVKLQGVPNLQHARVLYGSIAIGDKQKMAVVFIKNPNAQTRVYLDANRDGIITPAEGKLLQRGVVHWAACADDLSARIPVGLMETTNGTRQPIPRSAVVWACQAPNVVFFAWQGFQRGHLEIDGTQREAFLVDANSNGVFGDKGDQLWVDLNGDGRLDIASEEFAVAPVLRLGQQIYRLSVASDKTPALANEVRLARLEGGLGKAKLTLPTAPEAAVKDFAATIVSQLGDVAAANTLDQEVELPAGNYSISNLALQMAHKSEAPWKYSFSNWADTLDDKSYPLKIAKDTTTDVVTFRNLSLDAKVEGEKTPGTTLQVTLSAKSEMGLELTKTERPGDHQGGSEDYAHIELINPVGRVVGTAMTGFA